MAFLARDGFIDVAAFKEFNAECVKWVQEEIKENPKAVRTHKLIKIHYAPKVIPAFDAEKAKVRGDAFTKKRATPLRTRSRDPKDGQRVKMVVVFREYANMPADFQKDMKAALQALEKHNAKAQALVEKTKAQRTKDKESKAKAFDKVIEEITDLLCDAGIKEENIVVGQSMMGKSLQVLLPSKQVISIGLSDMQRFDKAKNPPAEGGGFGRGAKKAPAKPVRTGRK